MRTRLMWLGVPLAMIVSAHLAAQVTPVTSSTIVPIVGQTNVGALTQLIQGNVTIPQAGQMVHLFGRLEFAANVGTTQQGVSNLDYVGVWLECFDPSGQQAPGTQDIGENYLGPNQPPGPGYPTTGHVVLYPSTLITATTPGTYSCQMLAGADKSGWAVGRDNQGDNTTWLGVSTPIGFNDAFSWGGFSGCFWQGPYVAADQCLYLGPSPSSGAAPYVDVFSPVLTLPKATPGFWSPAPGAAYVDVTGVLQVSLCGKSEECDPKFRNSDTTSVVVESYLELDQLDAADKPFHKTVSPTQKSTIGNLLHHDMIFHRLTTVPVYPSSNPPKFQVVLLVTWDSGSTAKVDGAQAVAYTSYRGHPQAVPNVIGQTKSAASTTLSTSGYTVSVVSNGYSTAPPSSVIAQDPPPGIIGSPGSGVNLTLSTGSVNVPKVISLTQTEAEHAISSVGLITSVLSQPGCLDPGVVLLQSPAAGTGVSPGSPVSITVDSGRTAKGAKCTPD